MKSIFLNTLYLLFIFKANSCKAQENKIIKTDSITQKKVNMIPIPSLNDSFETINIEEIKKSKNIKYIGSNEFGTKEFRYNEITDQGEIQIADSYDDRSVTKTFFPKGSCFTICKIYYANGNIKKKYIYSDASFYGKFYEYDSTGKLTKENDYEAGYDFTWDNVQEYIAKRGIKLFLYPKTNDFRATNVNKKNINGRLLWIISWYTFDEKNLWKEVTLDGKTGKLLRERAYRMQESNNDPEPSKEGTYDIDYEKEATKIYKTYEGKDYTEAEWKIKEQELYNDYLKKTGRGDLVKPTDEPKTEGKKSNFLADDFEKGDDNSPKKKGFFG